MGFWGFWGFCCFILYRFENRWVFGVFAASYFVVLRVDGVFGVFAASCFIVLRIGGVFGVFGVFATSYFIVLRIGGFLGFLLLHTLYNKMTKYEAAKPHQLAEQQNRKQQ